MIPISVQFQELRKSRGMTLHEMSVLTGLSVSYLSDIERGRTEPTLKTLRQIAEACGLSLNVSLVEDGRRVGVVEVSEADLATMQALINEVAAHMRVLGDAVANE